MGVDPKLLADIINVSTGRSWSTEVYNPCPGVVETAPASRGYTGGFGSSLILKVGLTSLWVGPCQVISLVLRACDLTCRVDILSLCTSVILVLTLLHPLTMQDMKLALDAAATCDSNLPLGNATVGLYSDIVDKGMGGKDFSVAYAYLSKIPVKD